MAWTSHCGYPEEQAYHNDRRQEQENENIFLVTGEFEFEVQLM
jgi:hypothetical protein